MHLVSIPPLLAFAVKHPAATQAVLSWCDELKKSKWTRLADIKPQYASASILKSRRVVFNLKVNDDRLVVAVAYNTGFVFVKLIGTHAEYDDMDADTVEMY